MRPYSVTNQHGKPPPIEFADELRHDVVPGELGRLKGMFPCWPVAYRETRLINGVRQEVLVQFKGDLDGARWVPVKTFYRSAAFNQLLAIVGSPARDMSLGARRLLRLAIEQEVTAACSDVFNPVPGQWRFSAKFSPDDDSRILALAMACDPKGVAQFDRLLQELLRMPVKDAGNKLRAARR
jgi:hypothetical protein